MDNITGYMKDHPWATGIIVVVGGFIFIMISGVFSGGGSSSSGGPSDAEIAADAQVRSAAIAAQGQAQAAGAAIQAAQMSATTQMHSDELSAQVAMRELEVRRELGLDEGVTNRFSLEKQLEAQKDINAANIAITQSNNTLALGLEQNRNHVITTLNASNNKAKTAGGIIGAIGSIAGSIFGSGGIFSIFSDQRLKENIKYVGQNRDGFNIYEYNYKGSTTKRRSVIAQDVARSNPELIHVDRRSGYLMVSPVETGLLM